MSRKCTHCGRNQISVYWTFKNSAFCSYRCYATNSAGTLLVLSSFFAFIFIASMIGMSFAENVNPALYSPFIVALSLGPLPGYITSILGYIYRKQDKKHPPIKYEYPEEEIQKKTDIHICAICNKPIDSDEQSSEFEPCRHLIHKKHLAEWISENENCPECGNLIEKIKLD